MAKGTAIKPENFSSYMMSTLRAYGDECVSITTKILMEVGEESANTLRLTRWGWKTRRGKYQRSFKVTLRKNTGRLYNPQVRVYSQAPEYRLTHLLEKGHRTRIGENAKPGAKRFTKAYPHWADVEKQAIAELEEKLTLGLMDLEMR